MPKYTKETNKFIGSKIQKLMKEGMEHKQAIAVAHSMAKKEGHKVPNKPK